MFCSSFVQISTENHKNYKVYKWLEVNGEKEEKIPWPVTAVRKYLVTYVRFRV